MTSDPQSQVNFKADILTWLKDFVEKPHSALGDWPPCPYAQQARLADRIRFSLCPPDQFLLEMGQALSSFDEQRWDVVVLGTDKSFPLKEIAAARRALREEYRKSDLWLLIDHPEEEDQVNGVRFNNDQYCLAFIQPLSKLNAAARKLYEQGYYQSWTKENTENMWGGRGMTLEDFSNSD